MSTGEPRGAGMEPLAAAGAGLGESEHGRSELDPPASTARGPTRFVTTRWTMVLAAGGQASAGDERAALERLCQIYWPPVYAYVRRRGLSAEDAHELSQEFFTRLLERRNLGSVSPLRGRFRTWLLCCLKNFLVGEWKRSTARRRDARRLVWLDGAQAEERYRWEPQQRVDPECQYQRDWAMALLEGARQRLEAECEARGRGALFQHVQGWIVDGPDEGGYEALATALGTSSGSLKVTVCRWRQRWAELLREELEEQLDGTADGDVEQELQLLLGAMARPG